jgi:hypothetical protein
VVLDPPLHLDRTAQPEASDLIADLGLEWSPTDQQQPHAVAVGAKQLQRVDEHAHALLGHELADEQERPRRPPGLLRRRRRGLVARLEDRGRHTHRDRRVRDLAAGDLLGPRREVLRDGDEAVGAIEDVPGDATALPRAVEPCDVAAVRGDHDRHPQPPAPTGRGYPLRHDPVRVDQVDPLPPHGARQRTPLRRDEQRRLGARECARAHCGDHSLARREHLQSRRRKVAVAQHRHVAPGLPRPGPRPCGREHEHLRMRRQVLREVEHEARAHLVVRRHREGGGRDEDAFWLLQGVLQWE